MREFITGVFVIGGMIIAVAVYIYMVNYSSHRSGFTVYIQCENAGGINSRAEIRYRGVEMGYVKDVKITPQGVLIVGYVSDKVEMHKPVYGTIEDLSLIGGARVLNLHDSKDYSAPVLESGDTIRALRVSLWEDIANLSNIVRDLIKDGKLNDVLDILNSVKKEMYSLSKSLSIGNDAKRTIKRVDSLALRIDNILTKIENGEGTVGKTIYEDSMYNEIMNTLKDTDSLVNDIKNNPQKYIKIGIFK